jgi:geranylgeranyl diphosphate synthase type II
MIDSRTIDQAVARLFSELSFQEQPAGLYDPLRYTVALGGKRLRPRLCLLAYSFFKDELNDGILSPAAGLEVYHSFTLIHDDVMDRSPLRRGSETVWKKWSETTAILSGDVMCIDAFKRIAQAPVEVLPEALSLFSRTASEVCDGQQLDMDFESREMVGMDEYMQMIGLKTGVLLACSAGLGALIGGADARSRECLYDYGYNLGLAFQLADDYLDAYGDEKTFGKPIGGDILNGKKSWLSVRAAELLSERAAAGPGKADSLAAGSGEVGTCAPGPGAAPGEPCPATHSGVPCPGEASAVALAEALAAPAVSQEEKAAKIARVMALYESAGVAPAALSAISELTERAVSRGCEADISDSARDSLRSFAHSLVGRVK